MAEKKFLQEYSETISVSGSPSTAGDIFGLIGASRGETSSSGRGGDLEQLSWQYRKKLNHQLNPVGLRFSLHLWNLVLRLYSDIDVVQAKHLEYQ